MNQLGCFRSVIFGAIRQSYSGDCAACSTARCSSGSGALCARAGMGIATAQHRIVPAAIPAARRKRRSTAFTSSPVSADSA